MTTKLRRPPLFRKIFVRSTLWSIGLVSLWGVALQAADPPFEPLPYGSATIGYATQELDHPLQSLWQKSQTKTLELRKQGASGYLFELLQALKIPVSSQVLVFSKTSANAPLIDPKHPRAIYFNLDTYVAWVPQSEILEITAIDPRYGAVFFTLKQSSAEPRLERGTNCLSCHVSRETRGIPGLLMKSVTTSETGKPWESLGPVDSQTPWVRRFGGWYVTGAPPNFPHAGRGVGALKQFSEVNYPAPTSDLLSLIVLSHQVEIQNLLTRLRYEDQLKLPLTALDPLVEVVVQSVHASLPEPLSATEFSRDYPAIVGEFAKFQRQERLFAGGISPLLFGRTIQRFSDPLLRQFARRLLERWDDLSISEQKRLDPSLRQAVRNTLLRLHPGNAPAAGGIPPR